MEKSLSIVFVSVLTLLSSVISKADIAQGYLTGPYLNLGIGGSIYSVPLIFTDGTVDVTSLAARVGLGFIGDINQSQLPFFAGVEANFTYNSITNSQNSLYGIDLSGIIGKQVAQQVGLYAKLGANVQGRSGSYLFGPQIGAGLGVQVTPHVRLIAEADYAQDIFIGVTTIMAGLQYTF